MFIINCSCTEMAKNSGKMPSFRSQWGMEEEDKFVGYLLRERQMYPLDNSFAIECALRSVQQRMTRSLRWEIAIDDLRLNFQKLRSNYRTFSTILEAHGVVFYSGIDWIYVPFGQRPKLERVSLQCQIH